MTGFALPGTAVTVAPGHMADADLPAVTAVIPFYRETAEVLQRAGSWLKDIDYPAEKFDVLWVVDSDNPNDVETAERIAAHTRGFFSGRLIVLPVPSMSPKSRALNVALEQVETPVVALYDADAVPAADQLRIAAWALMREGYDIVDALDLQDRDDNPITSITMAQGAAFIASMDRLNQLTGTHMLLGSSVYCHREAMRTVGPFLETGVEELYEWSVRAGGAGLRMGRIDSFSLGLPLRNIPDALKQRARWNRGQLQIGFRFLRDPALPASARRAVLISTLSTIAQMVAVPTAIGALKWRALRVPAAVLLAGETLRIAMEARRPRWRPLGIQAAHWALLLPFELVEGVANWRALWELATGREVWHPVRAMTQAPAEGKKDH